MSIVTDQASDEKFSDVIKIEGEKIRSHVAAWPQGGLYQ